MTIMSRVVMLEALVSDFDEERLAMALPELAEPLACYGVVGVAQADRADFAQRSAALTRCRVFLTEAGYARLTADWEIDADVRRLRLDMAEFFGMCLAHWVDTDRDANQAEGDWFAHDKLWRLLGYKIAHADEAGDDIEFKRLLDLRTELMPCFAQVDWEKRRNESRACEARSARMLADIKDD